ncbi:hypothetical protein ACFQZE_07825 [Paenibacillus sp. GCM10027627]|uniref:hypothetical protein n=1 Tax=unclassified Paenibacillus TaxID=185978 RepID=UPI003632C986
MKETVKTSLIVMLFSLAAGSSLALFLVIEDFFRYVFSLLTLYMGIRFFRRYETVGKRILFIVLTVFFCALTTFWATVFRFMENPELMTSML